jgi:hypothetical protein
MAESFISRQFTSFLLWYQYNIMSPRREINMIKKKKKKPQLKINKYQEIHVDH